ncbi:MAG: transcriptional regulator, CdaR family [Chloroflexi bacterium]|nr:transcriptional regulator, CdaR family [Chloroflexota bacterium]
MTSEPNPGEEQDTGASLRGQLSNLQGLLVLSMRMTETGDEKRILHLATTAVPSLSLCRLQGVHLTDAGWRATTGPCERAEVRADLEAQFAVLSSAGGPVAILHEAWAWAFSLRSIEGHFGFLLVSAAAEPPPSQQFLLRVLAQQTGIALANARRDAHERASAAELKAANSALAGTVHALEQSTAIHQRLTQVAMAVEGEAGIAQAVHELTGYPVAVEDRRGHLRAWAGPGRPTPYPAMPRERREQMLRRALAEARPIRDGDRLLTVVSPRRDVLGVLALIDPADTAGIVERVALEHGATVLGMELARLRSLVETELRLRRDLVEELLTGIDDERALARAEALGHDLRKPHRVAVVEGGTDRRDDDDAFLHAVRRAAGDRDSGSLVVARGGVVVMVSQAESDWEGLRAAVLAQLSAGRCRIGVGGSCDHPADLPRSYREAQLALRVQRSSGGSDQATLFDQLGVYRLLAYVREEEGVDRFVREWLGTLLDYDEIRGGDLVATIGRYLECGGSYDATAAALGVHRSTLKYRLQRIREISGHDLTDPDTCFNLQLASRARTTLAAMRADRA